MSISKFRESGEYYSVKLGYFWLIVAGLSGIFAVLQTQWFVSCLRSANLTQIQQEIRLDEAIQRQRGEEYLRESHHPPQHGVLFHPALFNDTQRQTLQQELDILLGDVALETLLKQSFGHSLKEVNAVVLPGWELRNDFNTGQTGLTELGWYLAQTHAGDPNVLGFTVRDRGLPNAHQVTIDGVPRVALNLESFGSKKTLRLTLFHELLHAMNVPQFVPPIYTLLQTDLAYLPQYRSYVAQAQLEEWYDRTTWFFVFAPWAVFVATLYYIRRHRNKLKALRVQGP